MALVVTVNGAALPAGVKLLYRSLRISKDYGIETASMSIYDTDRVTPWRVNLTDAIRVTKDGALLFGGEAVEVEDSRILDPDAGGVLTRLRCRDWTFLLDDTVVTRTIAAGTSTTIVSGLVSDYLLVKGVTDITSGTGPAVPEMKFEKATLRTVLNAYKDLTGWAYRINGDKQFAFLEPGSIAAPYSLGSAAGDTMGGMTWAKTRVKYATRVFLQTGRPSPPAAATGTRVNTFTGNGTRRIWYLDVEPTEIPTQIVEGGTPHTFGAGVWTYSEEFHAVTRVTALAGGVNAVVTYNTEMPAWCRAIDPAIIDAAGFINLAGLTDVVVQDSAAVTLDQGVASAVARLAERTISPKVVKVSTRKPGFYPLQEVTLNFPGRDVSGTYLIQGVEIEDVGIKDSVTQSLRYTLTCVEGGTLLPSWRDYFRQRFGGSGGGGVMVSGSGTVGSGGSASLVRAFLGGSNEVAERSTSWVNVPGAVPLKIGGTDWPSGLQVRAYASSVDQGGGVRASVQLRLRTLGGVTLGSSAIVSHASPTAVTFSITTPVSADIATLQMQVSGSAGDVFIGMSQVENA